MKGINAFWPSVLNISGFLRTWDFILCKFLFHLQNLFNFLETLLQYQVHLNDLYVHFINVQNTVLLSFVWRKLTTKTSYSHQQSPFRSYFFLQGYQRSSCGHTTARTGRPILAWFFLRPQRPPIPTYTHQLPSIVPQLLLTICFLWSPFPFLIPGDTVIAW